MVFDISFLAKVDQVEQRPPQTQQIVFDRFWSYMKFWQKASMINKDEKEHVDYFNRFHGL